MYNRRSIALFGLLAILFIHSRGAYSQEQIAIGTVTAMRGSASAMSAGAVEALALGSAVYLGDVLTTEADSGVKILLDDDTLITLGENAQFELTEFVYTPGERRKSLSRLLGGVLKAIIQRFEGEESQVQFLTPKGIAGIKGTTIYIDADRGLFYVADGEALIAGIVPGAGEIRLGSGEFTTIEPDGNPASAAGIPEALKEELETETEVREQAPDERGADRQAPGSKPPTPPLGEGALAHLSALPVAQPIDLLPGVNERDEAPTEIIILPPPIQ